MLKFKIGTYLRFFTVFLLGVVLAVALERYYRTSIKEPEIQIVEIEKIVEVPKIVNKTITVKDTIIIYQTSDTKPVKVDPEELECMTLNIYREANNQSLAGQIAVGRVVMNRVQDRRFPNSVCEVIFEGPTYESWTTKNNPTLPDDQRIYYPVRDRCQFSWYCDGKPDEVEDRTTVRWKATEDVAYQILAFNRWSGLVEGATHYHADYVKPNWSRIFKLIAKIDDHIFYRSE
jgi:spore germination cell wall hydrolase CwlJ-like protein